MKLTMIAAQAENRVIGRNNQLPWYLPEDLKYFKRVTMGKPIIMGRKTYESIGKPLPGRTNIVLTSQPGFSAEGVVVCHSMDEAVEHASAVAEVNGCDEAVVIGGEAIYTEMLPRADRIYLTEVHAQVEGDAFFPAFDRGDWQEVARESFARSGPNPYDYSFVVLDRRR